MRCLPGGSLAECSYFSGALVHKNIAHRKMRSSIKHPRVLVLKFALEHQRVENKFESMSALLLQERGYLHNLVSKITWWQPDLIVVERSVARLAQELLLEKGITLMLNVAPEDVDYIARCTKAEALKNIEDINFHQNSAKKIGTCEHFLIRRFKGSTGNIQSLACFEGCDPRLGCTMVLRGSDAMSELKDAEGVLLFAAYASYMLRLEGFLLANQYALPQSVFSTGSSVPEEVDLVFPEGFEDHSEMSKQFYNKLSQRTLSTSPFVKFPLPYLYTPEGAGCQLRKYISSSPYHSKLLSRTSTVGLDDDCMQPENHQCIDVLYSCTDARMRATVPPQKVTMTFFGENDMTIGAYVEFICLPTSKENAEKEDSSKKDRDEEAVTRSFAHQKGRVIVCTEQLKTPMDHPDGDGDTDVIFMWSWCKICQHATPVLPMSQDTWTLSLGKYLELCFYGSNHVPRGGVCNHSIFKHHIRYFGRADQLVYFEYEPISLLTLVMPQQVMALPRANSTVATWEAGLEEFDKAVQAVHSQVGERIKLIETASQTIESQKALKEEIQKHKEGHAKSLALLLQFIATEKQKILMHFQAAQEFLSECTAAAMTEAQAQDDTEPVLSMGESGTIRMEQLMHTSECTLQAYVAVWNDAIQDVVQPLRRYAARIRSAASQALFKDARRSKRQDTDADYLGMADGMQADLPSAPGDRALDKDKLAGIRSPSAASTMSTQSAVSQKSSTVRFADDAKASVEEGGGDAADGEIAWPDGGDPAVSHTGNSQVDIQVVAAPEAAAGGADASGLSSVLEGDRSPSADILSCPTGPDSLVAMSQDAAAGVCVCLHPDALHQLLAARAFYRLPMGPCRASSPPWLRGLVSLPLSKLAI